MNAEAELPVFRPGKQSFENQVNRLYTFTDSLKNHIGYPCPIQEELHAALPFFVFPVCFFCLPLGAVFFLHTDLLSFHFCFGSVVRDPDIPQKNPGKALPFRDIVLWEFCSSVRF